MSDPTTHSETQPTSEVVSTKTVMQVADTERATNPQQVKCADCEHVWIGFYLPQPISVAAKMMKNICCPKCGAGAKRIMVHL